MAAVSNIFIQGITVNDSNFIHPLEWGCALLVIMIMMTIRLSYLSQYNPRYKLQNSGAGDPKMRVFHDRIIAISLPCSHARLHICGIGNDFITPAGRP